MSASDRVHTAAQSLSETIKSSTMHPLLLFVASFTIDTLQLLPDRLTELLDPVVKYLPTHEALNLISYSASAAGLLASIPAAIAGARDAINLFKEHASKARASGRSVKETAQETFTAAQKEDSEARKMGGTLVHAALNQVVIAIAAYNCWSRHGEFTHQLPTFNAVLSAIALPVLGLSAIVGFTLAGVYGMGHVKKDKGKQKRQE